MIRIRRLQRRDAKGKWYDDSYAIEQPTGEIEFRYNLTWERIGGEYAFAIKQSGLPLEQVEQVWDTPKMRWLPGEVFDMTYEEATELLDPQFHIPRLKKKILVPAT